MLNRFCYYKAFIANVAANVATELSKKYTVEELKTKDVCEDIALASSSVASTLADELEEYWRTEGNPSTVFFDPSDQPDDKVANMLYDIAEAIKSSNNQ